jgi:hypothetical protein
MVLDFQYLEIDGVEFDTYWQNGGYKKISDIIFAEWHIFIVSNLWRNHVQLFLSFTFWVKQNFSYWEVRTKIFAIKIKHVHKEAKKAQSWFDFWRKWQWEYKI